MGHAQKFLPLPQTEGAISWPIVGEGLVMLLVPAPSYSLERAAWIPRVLIWRDDGIMDHREGESCETWTEAMRASWRLNATARRAAE